MTQRFCNFNSHCSKTTNSDNSNDHLVSFCCSPLFQRVVHRDSCAEDWSSYFKWDVFWNFENKVLVHNIRSGISTICWQVFVSWNTTILTNSVVSATLTGQAVLLISLEALRAVQTCINHAADSYSFSDFEPCDIFANLRDCSNQLVSGHAWIPGKSHVVLANMAISVADSTVEKFELDMVISTDTSVNPHWLELAVRCLETPRDFLVLISLWLWVSLHLIIMKISHI